MCNRKRSLCSIALVGLLGSLLVPAQLPQNPLPPGSSTPIAGIQTELTNRLEKSHDVTFTKKRLAEDRVQIEKAANIVVPDFKTAGYSDEEASSGLAWTWFELRAGDNSLPLTNDLTTKIIREKAAKQGRLVVNSRPKEGVIFVDDIKWPRPTDSEGFAIVGERRVLVKIKDMEPAQATCVIERDQIAVFRATLHKKGSKALCVTEGGATR